MSWAHLHLALNHVPVIGLPIALLLLGWGAQRRSAELIRAALGLMVLLGLATILVQLTGEPAEELIEGLPGVREPVIERHEEAALIATIGTAALGLWAAFGLWRYRAGRAFDRWYSTLLLVAGLFVAGFLGWVANLGGQIRHPEIAPQRGVAELVDPSDRD